MEFVNQKMADRGKEVNSDNESIEIDSSLIIKDCKIKCLQNIEELNVVCKQLNLTFNESKMTSRKNKKRTCQSDEYEVEKIVDYAREQCEDWYLVKWKGWESDFNTWEPYKNLLQCQALISEYHKKHKISNHKPNLGVKRKLNSSYNAKRENLQKLYKLFLEVCNSSKEDLATLLKLKGISIEEFANSKETVKKLKQDLKNMFSSSLHNGNNITMKKLEEWCDTDLMTFAEQRKEVLRKLKLWETEINVLSEHCPIVVENDVDLEGPPENFIYITDYKAADGISIPEDPLVGCECKNCFENQNNCCAMQSGGSFAYNRYGYLKVQKGTPVYECNIRCHCSSDCLNRVVQKGRQVKLSIFRTHDGRGWGVKTLEKIKKGTFVMEYVGEVITSEEAERRGQIYDLEGRTYLFDLDYNDGDCPFTVDAAHYGNVAHFMNHSCNPNLVVYGVWINNLDPRLPRIAFFSQREIKKGEELTFDYLMTSSASAITSSPSKVPISSLRDNEDNSENYTMPTSLSFHSPNKLSTISTEQMYSPKKLFSNSVEQIPVQNSSPIKYMYSSADITTKSKTQIEKKFNSPSKLTILTEQIQKQFNSPTKSTVLNIEQSQQQFTSPNKQMVGLNHQAQKRIVCKCGATNCRGYLF